MLYRTLSRCAARSPDWCDSHAIARYQNAQGWHVQPGLSTDSKIRAFRVRRDVKLGLRHTFLCAGLLRASACPVPAQIPPRPARSAGGRGSQTDRIIIFVRKDANRFRNSQHKRCSPYWAATMATVGHQGTRTRRHRVTRGQRPGASALLSCTRTLWYKYNVQR